MEAHDCCLYCNLANDSICCFAVSKDGAVAAYDSSTVGRGQRSARMRESECGEVRCMWLANLQNKQLAVCSLLSR